MSQTEITSFSYLIIKSNYIIYLNLLLFNPYMYMSLPQKNRFSLYYGGNMRTSMFSPSESQTEIGLVQVSDQVLMEIYMVLINTSDSFLLNI